jgi:peptidoglycan/LPS O-acetylase OafA/YrhL
MTMPGFNSAGGERLVGLDILRASAIVLVLISHIHLIGPFRSNPFLFSAGMWGVELFFILSGYTKFKIYLIRRWMRTIPLYYVAIIVTIILESYFLGLPINDIGLYFTFTQTIPTGEIHWFGVSWSLSIEEWSYILIPIVALTLWFIPSLDKRFAFVFLTLIIAFSVLRLWQGQFDLSIDNDIRRALIPRLDALAYGGLFRILWLRYRPELQGMRTKLLASSLLLQILVWVMFFIFGSKNNFLALSVFTLLPITLCLCFPFAISKNNLPNLTRLIFHFVASRSYALYLFHVPIYMLVGKYVTGVGFQTRIIIGLGLAFLIAEITYRCVEKPFMDLRPSDPTLMKSSTDPVRSAGRI